MSCAGMVYQGVPLADFLLWQHECYLTSASTSICPSSKADQFSDKITSTVRERNLLLDPVNQFRSDRVTTFRQRLSVIDNNCKYSLGI